MHEIPQQILLRKIIANWSTMPSSPATRSQQRVTTCPSICISEQGNTEGQQNKSCSLTVFSEKGHVQIYISGKSSKKEQESLSQNKQRHWTNLQPKKKKKSWKKLFAQTRSEIWGWNEVKQGNRNNFLVTERQPQSIVWPNLFSNNTCSIHW